MDLTAGECMRIVFLQSGTPPTIWILPKGVESIFYDCKMVECFLKRYSSSNLNAFSDLYFSVSKPSVNFKNLKLTKRETENPTTTKIYHLTDLTAFRAQFNN